MQKLQAMIKEAAEQDGEVSFRNTYSGRGMFGKNCVALVGTRDQINRVIAAVIKEMNNLVVDAGMDGSENELLSASEEFDENIDTLLNYEQDSMGFDIVVYWRRLAPLPDEEDVGEESTTPSSAS